MKTGAGKYILRVTRPNDECSQNLVSNPVVGHQTNSRTLKHLSFEWPIYAKNNNNKILTSSSDKVVSGCLLVYGNVFTARIPFQGLKKCARDRKFVSSNSRAYLSLYGISAAVRHKVFVTQ